MSQLDTLLDVSDVLKQLTPESVAWLDEAMARNRAAYGGMRMMADGDDADDGDDGSQDDGDGDGEDGAEGSGATGDDGDDDSGDGADALGDAGKQALDRMKAKWQEERDKRRQAESKLADKDDDKADEKSAEVLTRANARIVKSEVKAAAKGVLADPADAYKFLDLDAFEVDDDGNVDEDEIADAIAELVKKKPYLAAQGGRRFKGSADGGARKDSRPKQLTRADLQGMTPTEIDKAHKEGRLHDLIKS